jgi:hypothetical protein
MIRKYAQSKYCQEYSKSKTNEFYNLIVVYPYVSNSITQKAQMKTLRRTISNKKPAQRNKTEDTNEKHKL